MVCVFSVYMIYSNKIFLKNENMLTTISCDSAHMVIPGQSLKTGLKLKYLENMILLSKSGP